MLRSIFDRVRPKASTSKLEDINQHAYEDLVTRFGTDKRFRVLVLGPRNAGKTTLLERLSNSPAGSAIVTRNGQRVMRTMLRLRIHYVLISTH